MDLGVALKILLVKKKLRHIDLGERLGVTRQQVSRWANTGRIHEKYIKMICNEFNIKASEFIALGE